MNRCIICGRPLHDPVSMKRGIGPVCDAKINEPMEQQSNDHQIITPYKPGDDIILKRDGDVVHANIGRHIVKHSPTGIEWGYGGSGPADLALSILANFCDLPVAAPLYQQFKWEFVAGIPKSGGTIARADILKFLYKTEPKHPDGDNMSLFD